MLEMRHLRIWIIALEMLWMPMLFEQVFDYGLRVVAQALHAEVIVKLGIWNMGCLFLLDEELARRHTVLIILGCVELPLETVLPVG